MQATVCTIREAPASSQLVANPVDPARQTVFPEPVLQIENIQGSIIPGFSKSHRILLFLRVHREDGKSPSSFKRWLKGQIPFVATADEVLAFSKLFKCTRLRRKREGTVKSTWMGISLSYNLLHSLNHEAKQFIDKAFKEGLHERSKD